MLIVRVGDRLGEFFAEFPGCGTRALALEDNAAGGFGGGIFYDSEGCTRLQVV